MIKQWNFKNIPKIMHFYHGEGRQKMSWLRYLSFLSFKKYNPDWKIILHVPTKPYMGDSTWSECPKHPVMVNQSWFGKLKELQNIELLEHDFDGTPLQNAFQNYRADYLRLKCLSEIGGGFSDTDILFMKPITEIKQNTNTPSNIDILLCKYEEEDTYPIGMIFSSKENDFMIKATNGVLGNLDLSKYESLGPDYIRGGYKVQYQSVVIQ